MNAAATATAKKRLDLLKASGTAAAAPNIGAIICPPRIPPAAPMTIEVILLRAALSPRNRYPAQPIAPPVNIQMAIFIGELCSPWNRCSGRWRTYAEREALHLHSAHSAHSAAHAAGRFLLDPLG